MRMAADRVAASLKRLDYAEAPVWEAAQARLLARLLPGAAAAADPTSAASEAGGGPPTAARLAAAVAAAAAAAPAVPLEAEGVPFEERRPKVSAAGSA